MSYYQNTLSEDKEQQIAYNLNLYCFQNIWNETYRSLRLNVKPQMVDRRSRRGNIYVYGEYFELPNINDSFYLYVASTHALKALSWPKAIEYDWMSTDRLVNEYDILFDVYSTNGKIMHKKDVYIKKLPGVYGYMIAISKNMSAKVLDHSLMDSIRFTNYYDFDFTTHIDVFSYEVPLISEPFGVKYDVWNKYQECLSEPLNTYGKKPTVILSVNGEEMVPVDMGSIPDGASVDIFIDRNTYFDIEIDLTDPKNNTAFFSDLDNCFKNIIHIPIENNPDNYVVSHNAIEIYVRKKSKEVDGTIRGLYLHRCAERSVTQITHQDIGIPTYILDAYRDYFGDSEITIRLYFRLHPGANYLIRDKNYIDLLYQNNPNDSDILAFLGGYHQWSPDLSFWKASHLEASEYTNMIFDIPDIITPSNMYKYVEALGYYNTMYLLCKHIHRVVVTDTYDRSYMYAKPLVYQGTPVEALVYVDGVKIPSHSITVDNISDTHVTVGVPKTIAPVGSKLTVELHRTGTEFFYKITPSATSNEITFSPTEYDLIQEVPVTNGQVTDQYDYQGTTGYIRVEHLSGKIAQLLTTDGKYRLIFGPETYGNTYYIQPRPRTLHWISTNPEDEIDIQAKLNNNDPLFFKLVKKARYESINGELEFYLGTDKVLVYDTDYLIVYVNNRYLIKDIDYTVHDILNYDGNLCMKILVIQNTAYLTSTNDNLLEIYSTSAEDANQELGYCAPRRTDPNSEEIEISGVINNNRTVLFNEGTSMVHVNGYYTDTNIVGNYISKDPTWEREWEAANPIEIRTSIPYFVSDYLKKYHIDDDLARIELLNKYYYARDLRKVEIELISQSHLLYSTYVAAILRDIINNITPISYDPDISRMIEQLSRYSYLKETDLTYLDVLNMNYVDIYPHYAKLVAPDVEMYRLLQSIIKICMPPDPVSNKQDVDVSHP